MRYSFLAVLLFAVPVFAAVEVVDEIVCKANGDMITRTDLEKNRKQLGLSNADLLRDGIDRLLLVEKAKELDIKVDTDLNKRMGDLQRRSGIADPEKFQAYVKEQTGMSYEDYKAQEKNQMLTQRVIGEEVSRKINFKREELEAYYNDHKDEFIREERVFLREDSHLHGGQGRGGHRGGGKESQRRGGAGETGAEISRAGATEFRRSHGAGWRRTGSV